MLELNEIPNEDGRCATDFVWCFLIFTREKLSFLRRHCVTDSAKISSIFTDRGPIFIDASVKGSDFAKCSACSISPPSHQSKLPTRFVSGYSHHKQAIVMHTQKNRIRFATDCKSSGFSI
ncbi:hypothetical protein PND15_09030 [Ligilactobacillus ruminis]|nr:hypothetical protein [Ligilactobacillus ruminis]